MRLADRDGGGDLAVGEIGGEHYRNAPELKAPVIALSLGGLRRRIESLLVPDDVVVVLQLDRAARLERGRRPRAASLKQSASIP